MDVLRIEALAQGGEAGDIHEEDGDDLALALEGRARGQDLLGQVLGRVGARGIEPVGRGPFCGGERLPAFLAKAMAGGIRGPALRTEGGQPGSTTGAELGVGRSLKLASGTFHA